MKSQSTLTVRSQAKTHIWKGSEFADWVGSSVCTRKTDRLKPAIGKRTSDTLFRNYKCDVGLTGLCQNSVLGNKGLVDGRHLQLGLGFCRYKERFEATLPFQADSLSRSAWWLLVWQQPLQMNGVEDCRWQAVLDHSAVFSTYTLLTTMVNGSENNGLHQAFYLNVWECVYCTGSSAASIQMSRNTAGSREAPATVWNCFTNYSALMQTPLVSSCVIRCVSQLKLVFASQRSACCVCHDCASAIPYLYRGAPLQFHSAYHLRPSGGKVVRSKTPFGCWPRARQSELYLPSLVLPLLLTWK